MTEHSPNDQFHASSFLQGANAGYVEQMYARYAADPNAVDASWASFFGSLGDNERDVRKEAEGASWGRADWPPVPRDDLTAALTGEWQADAKAAGDKIKAKAAETGAQMGGGAEKANSWPGTRRLCLSGSPKRSCSAT